jgi:hypothetical protein
MKMVALIIVLQFMVTLLTGCAEFPIAAKMEQMRSEQLTCGPADSEMCAGWKVGEF